MDPEPRQRRRARLTDALDITHIRLQIRHGRPPPVFFDSHSVPDFSAGDNAKTVLLQKNEKRRGKADFAPTWKGRLKSIFPIWRL